MNVSGLEGVIAFGSGDDGDGDNNEVKDLVDEERGKVIFGFCFAFVTDFGVVDEEVGSVNGDDEGDEPRVLEN